MKNKIVYVSTPLVIALAIGLVTFFVSTYFFLYGNSPLTTSAQSTPKGKGREIKFFNQTKSFQIVKNEIIGGDLYLVLQNNYDKSINGFYVTEDRGNGDGVNTTVELTYSGFRTEIAPGEQFTYRTGASEALYKYGLTISTVIFTDGAGEGDPEIVQRVAGIRRGTRFQMERGLEFLRGSFSTEDFQARLAGLKDSVADLKIKDEVGSADYNSGLSEGKERLKLYLKDIEKSSKSIGFDKDLEFSNLERRLEKIISLSPR